VQAELVENSGVAPPEEQMVPVDPAARVGRSQDEPPVASVPPRPAEVDPRAPLRPRQPVSGCSGAVDGEWALELAADQDHVNHARRPVALRPTGRLPAPLEIERAGVPPAGCEYPSVVDL
jgi:hypothetical protein